MRQLLRQRDDEGRMGPLLALAASEMPSLVFRNHRGTNQHFASVSRALMLKDRIVVYALAVVIDFEAAFLGFIFTLTRPW